MLIELRDTLNLRGMTAWGEGLNKDNFMVSAWVDWDIGVHLAE